MSSKDQLKICKTIKFKCFNEKLKQILSKKTVWGAKSSKIWHKKCFGSQK
jgi:hypothetical protein